MERDTKGPTTPRYIKMSDDMYCVVSCLILTLCPVSLSYLVIMDRHLSSS